MNYISIKSTCDSRTGRNKIEAKKTPVSLLIRKVLVFFCLFCFFVLVVVLFLAQLEATGHVREKPKKCKIVSFSLHWPFAISYFPKLEFRVSRKLLNSCLNYFTFKIAEQWIHICLL